MSVEKVFDGGGANGVNVFVVSSGGFHMNAVVRGGTISLVSCCPPSDSAFSALETLGRVKHVFLLSTAANASAQIEWSAAFVKKFSALLWAPTAVSGVDMLLSKETLLPFPGKVFLFSSVRNEAVLLVSQHRLVLSGSASLPLSGSDEKFERWSRQSEGSLAKDYESMLTTLRPDVFLQERSLLTRSSVIENIIAANNRGTLSSIRSPPRSKLRFMWFLLFLLNIGLLLVYIVSRGYKHQ